jgi:signal transduction histidine kinase
VLALLRSLWDEPRPPDAPRRVWRDWLLVGVLIPVAVLEGAVRPDLPWRAVSVVLTVALVPALLWRRTRPLLVVAIVFGACSLMGLLTNGEAPGNYTLAFVLLLPYTLFRWGSGREAAIGAAIVLARVVVSIVTGDVVGADLLALLAILFAAMASGGALRYRAGARQRELLQVKLLERERLARDLHDTVAHHVSAIALRAQAGLATSGSNPDAAVEALRVIESEASRSLAEMRTIVRALRRSEQADQARRRTAGPAGENHAELAPGPRVADLELLAGHDRTGPSVDVAIADGLDDLAPSVSAALYRLAQESVTNARRHARHATRIEVRVDADDMSVQLYVSDDGDSRQGRPAAPPGYGLVGMIERASLLGGTCTAGPDPERGWTVTAVLPRAGG